MNAVIKRILAPRKCRQRIMSIFPKDKISITLQIVEEKEATNKVWINGKPMYVKSDQKITQHSRGIGGSKI